MVEDSVISPTHRINSSMVTWRASWPSLAGMLIAVTSEGWCFLIDGISYIAVIVSLLMMRLNIAPVRAKLRRLGLT